MKLWKIPTPEVIDKTLLAVRKETDRQYFFFKLLNPHWIKPLREGGYFGRAPSVKNLPNNRIQFTLWPEIQYLKNVCNEAPEEVISILIKLPESDNPRIYDDIIDIALKLKGEASAQLKTKIIEGTKLKYRFFTHKYSNIINYWIKEGATEAAIDLAGALFEAQTPSDSDRDDPWGQQNLLVDAIRPLADVRPYDTASILIKTTTKVLGRDFKSETFNDHSEIWCRRLSQRGEYEGLRAQLVNTLAYSCEQLYRRSPEKIPLLDASIKEQHWLVFRRLRQYLFSIFPSEQNKPEIRHLILSHSEYSKWDYHYEFQQMIQAACTAFGDTLLSKNEKTAIFKQILSGPSLETFKKFMGDRFTEDGFTQRQNYFWRKQLRPFASILFEKYKDIYATLAATADKVINDEDYSPVGNSRSGFISYRSPRTPDELSKLSDEDLLLLINNWQEAHRDPDDWLIEITIPALAGAFETVLRQHIFPDTTRSNFWFSQTKRIARPIYIRFLLKAVQEELKSDRYDVLPAAFEICHWILAKPDEPELEDGTTHQPNEESSERPAWGQVRREVVDLIGACVSKDSKTPFDHRSSLASLLAIICNQRDSSLDDKRSHNRNQIDPLSNAINNPRGIALEKVIDLGFWIRRYNKTDTVPEVSRIFDQRLSIVDTLPLTSAEYALFGQQFPNIIALDETWAIARRDTLFPIDISDAWEDAFGTYIRYNNPYRRPFEVLRRDYIYALDQFDAADDTDDGRKGWGGSLGQHFFMFYVWGFYPLTGSESLLERFYAKTATKPKRWAELLNHSGHLLRNTTEKLDQDIKGRLVAFAEWRVAQNNPEELSSYTFWLDGKCLDARWRLETFSKILDVAPGKDIGTSLKIDALNSLLSEQPALVVQCFSKIVAGLDKEDFVYIQTDQAKPILKVGLTSLDASVRKNAEDARESLLRAARFDFLDN